MPFRIAFALLAAAAALPGLARADPVRLAVAANFAEPARRIAAGFERATGHAVALSIGSTGKLSAQIRNGGPYDVLLAADAATPARLEAETLAVAGSRFTYAIGRLVLWSARPDTVDPEGEVLRSGRFSHVAICNPELAPYGAAAVQALRAMGLYERLRPLLVQGESVAQAYQFVASGNAELGFVSLSQVTENGRLREGSAWIVPSSLYSPLRQDAVLLAPGRASAAARAWLDWLKQPAAQAIIRSYGYELPGEGK
jgi:molybdate transport system substrate-binding protein